jgi:hypothetical protein
MRGHTTSSRSEFGDTRLLRVRFRGCTERGLPSAGRASAGCGGCERGGHTTRLVGDAPVGPNRGDGRGTGLADRGLHAARHASASRRRRTAPRLARRWGPLTPSRPTCALPRASGRSLWREVRAKRVMRPPNTRPGPSFWRSVAPARGAREEGGASSEHPTWALLLAVGGFGSRCGRKRAVCPRMAPPYAWERRRVAGLA